MFTGLIEWVCPIKAIKKSAIGKEFSIALGDLSEGVVTGDSVCVNGVCLTVSRLDKELACFDIMQETLRVSALGDLQVADRVNLERAMAAGGRFGGHFVQGHVDGTGTVGEIQRGSDCYTIWINAEPALLRLMIAKGSVTIDGVSLTIVTVEEKRFSVSLIPTTLKETNLGDRQCSDRVNLEADIISKWINQRLDQVLVAGDGKRLTLKKLQEQGFV